MKEQNKADLLQKIWPTMKDDGMSPYSQMVIKMIQANLPPDEIILKLV